MKTIQKVPQPQHWDFSRRMSPSNPRQKTLSQRRWVISFGLAVLFLPCCGEEPLTWTPPGDEYADSNDVFVEDRDGDALSTSDPDSGSENELGTTTTPEDPGVIVDGPADECPDDPDKTQPGLCGCGENEDDDDADGTPNCEDECPLDPDKTQPGFCGCGENEDDDDADGTPNCEDECPLDSDKTQPGFCGCGRAEDDNDLDGTPNCNDECPLDPGKTQPGQCGCFVREGTCGKEPYIEPSKHTYIVGEPIVIEFYNLTRDKKNWVGLFKSKAPDKDPLERNYTEGKKEGTIPFIHLPPGIYDARLFFKDSFDLEDAVTFVVTTP